MSSGEATKIYLGNGMKGNDHKVLPRMNATVIVPYDSYASKNETSNTNELLVFSKKNIQSYR